MAEEWTTVTKKKKPKKSRPSNTGGKTFSDFLQLKIKCPHLMMPDEIHEMAQRMNVDGLVDKFRSEDWIEFQMRGWKFVKVVKPEHMNQIPNDPQYTTLSLDNGWGDVVLFKQID